MLFALTENIDFFYTPSDFDGKDGVKKAGQRLRIGGLVVEDRLVEILSH